MVEHNKRKRIECTAVLHDYNQDICRFKRKDRDDDFEFSSLFKSDIFKLINRFKSIIDTNYF